jgi:acyl-CoA thioesterase FadM
MKIGNKSITAAYVMQNLKTGEVAATLEAVYVLFDLEARCGVEIGDDLRSAASKYLDTD